MSDAPPFAGEYSDGGLDRRAEPDEEEARGSARQRRPLSLERAHKSVVPPGETPMGAPRSGSA